MKNKLLIIAILIYALSMSVPLNTLAQVFEETLPKEGISAEDFLRTVNYYYENPQPQKLFTCLIVILTQEEVIKDPDKFNLFARFCALVCRKDSNFLENIKRLKEKSSGIQQNAIQQILTYAENYEEPYMIFSAGDLECFLIEFLFSGDAGAIKEIINVLGYPESEQNMSLKLAAESSLASAAKINSKAHEIIKGEFQGAAGKLKDALQRVLDNVALAQSSAKGFTIDYVRDKAKFKTLKVDTLTSEEEMVIQKSIEYLSIKYKAKIDGAFSAAKSKNGYQVNFWDLKMFLPDGAEIKITEGFGELFFDDSLELKETAIGP